MNIDRTLESLFNSIFADDQKLPTKDCASCEHKRHPQDGHCYMFKDEPAGTSCGQFSRYHS